MLGDERRGARLQRDVPNLHIVERGHDDNVRLRRRLFHPTADFKAVDVGKHQIKHKDIGAESDGGFDRMFSSRGSADEVARSFQQPVETGEDQRMIVG